MNVFYCLPLVRLTSLDEFMHCSADQAVMFKQSNIVHPKMTVTTLYFNLEFRINAVI